MCADGNAQEFDKYNLNHDGVLDADEMALQGVPASNVRRLDANGDGVVDENELRHAAEHAVLRACHNALPDKPDAQPPVTTQRPYRPASGDESGRSQSEGWDLVARSP